jgi:hypothetical protein
VATNLSAEVRHATNYLSCGDDSGKFLFFRNGGNAPSVLVLEWEVLGWVIDASCTGCVPDTMFKSMPAVNMRVIAAMCDKISLEVS